MRVDSFDRVVAIPTLVKDFDLWIFFQQHTKVTPGQRLVVDNQCLDLRSHSYQPRQQQAVLLLRAAPAPTYKVLNGSSIVTSTPPPGRLRISN
jgi:hypothetical protein